MSANRHPTVCVVGAGAAGLCAARHLAENGFDFNVYEQTANVGGIWNYTDSVGIDANGLAIHTSMYKLMRTNLPMEIMEFPDFKSHCKQSFVSHTEVLDYLKEYSKHFGLEHFIEFNHQIKSIKRFENVWKVVVKNVEKNVNFEKLYDSVIVCHGRYSMPYIPNDLPGMDRFTGKAIHSHDYRVPQHFTGQKVLVLGAGPSGVDIAIELSQTAQQVILNYKGKQMFPNLPQNIKQVLSPIRRMEEREVEFESGTKETIDAIIFCTGYKFNISFMDKSCGISVNQLGRVVGVYMHLVNISEPSMALMGIPIKVVPFPLYQQQVLFFLKCLTKQLVLPSAEEMRFDTERDLSVRKSMGLSEKYAHKMFGQLYYQYSDKLAQMADIEALPPVFRQLYDDLEVMRKTNLAGYKNFNFHIVSPNKYVIRD